MRFCGCDKWAAGAKDSRISAEAGAGGFGVGCWKSLLKGRGFGFDERAWRLSRAASRLETGYGTGG